MSRLQREIFEIINKEDGDWAFSIQNPLTEERFGYQEERVFSAASIIKIPILMEVYRQDREGSLSLGDSLVLQEKDVVGGCGVLQIMHEGLELSVRDIAILMITISDNTATNMLIDLVGIDKVNDLIQSVGAKVSVLRRKLMKPELAEKGIHNHLGARDVLIMLKALDQGCFLDQEACSDMLSILKLQQLNHKIPLLLPEGAVVAHKTGEDTGLTHNAGIIYKGDKKFYVCCLAENLPDPVRGHQVIARIARACYDTYFE